MSVKREYEIKTHTVTERVLVKETISCDVCSGEINTDNGYWELTTHHYGWGNDSCESYEHFDICSETCLKGKFCDYVKQSEKEVERRMCFEVERV